MKTVERLLIETSSTKKIVEKEKNKRAFENTGEK